MTALVAAAAFLLTFLPLIVFHELGHYAVARWCGVHVERFSIGFGKPFWRYRRSAGATEWVLAPIPLGGYVLLRDSRNAPAAAPAPALPGDLACTSPWQRMAISAAGPAANVLLAVLLLATLFIGGAPGADPTLGTVQFGTPAYRAGLQRGDRIVAVGQRPVRSWDELQRALLPTLAASGRSDLTVEVDGGRAQRTLLAGQGAPDGGADAMSALGLYVWRQPAVVDTLDRGGPAAKAGVLVGDEVWSVYGTRTLDATEVIARIRPAAGEYVKMTLRRGAGLVDVVFVAARDADGNGKAGIGLRSEPRWTTVRYGPADAILLALQRSWQMLAAMATMLGQMAVGLVSLGLLSGPIGVAQEAGRMASMGLAQGVMFAAAMSLNLALVNLLPLAALDGGAVVGAALEAARGKPPSARALRAARLCGMLVLALLFGIATFNDLGRLG